MGIGRFKCPLQFGAPDRPMWGGPGPSCLLFWSSTLKSDAGAKATAASLYMHEEREATGKRPGRLLRDQRPKVYTIGKAKCGVAWL